LTIAPELDVQILRYFPVEKWRVGTIARPLGLHHETVDRGLSQAGLPKAQRARRPSGIDPFVPFMVETLKRFPTLTAARLYTRVRERGYRGGPDHFRHRLTPYRPRPLPEAYLRLRTLAGEQGPVEWVHMGKIRIGRALRPLMAFVLVLSFSRRIFLRFFLDARMANFLRGHVAAFGAWNGLPRVLLYDNVKSAVLERSGSAIRFHPTLLAFAAHDRFEPRPVAGARGNEKGRVERASRCVREGFFAGRTWADLDELNAQAGDGCLGQASDRPCPEARARTVREVFAQEPPLLLARPDHPFPTDEQASLSVGKTPYVRFDGNDYSIPPTHVHRTLAVVACPTEVRVLEGSEVIARPPRSFDKGAPVEDEAHLAALWARTRAGRAHRAVDRLAHAVPNSRTLPEAAAERGENLGSLTAALLRLLAHSGAAELAPAIDEALARGVPHPNAVRLALERRREQRRQPTPLALPLPLPADPRVREAVVRPHALDTYDRLHPPGDPNDDDHR
jgi:transposase